MSAQRQGTPTLAGRGAPGRRRVARKVREREMLRVASRTFGQRGFAETSMAELAQAVGVTKPLLYAYFGSKECLFTACVREAAAAVRARVEQAAAAPGRPPDARLWAALLEVFSFVEEYEAAWRLLYSAGRFESAAAEAREAMEGLVASLFQKAADEQGIEVGSHTGELAKGFTAATIAMATSWLDRGDEPKEVAALRLMNMVWRGFEGMLDGRVWLPGPAEASA